MMEGLPSQVLTIKDDGQDCNDVGGIDLTGEFRLTVKKFLEMLF